jgi:uncharacterized paraquat-inducible protein A
VKCAGCGAENKDNTAHCRKCGASLIVMWSPTRQWHIKTLAVIYACLIILYFVLNWLLKPYMREIPPEVTPWLKKAQQIHK